MRSSFEKCNPVTIGGSLRFGAWSRQAEVPQFPTMAFGVRHIHNEAPHLTSASRLRIEWRAWCR